MAASPSQNEKTQPEQMGVGLMLGGATGLTIGGVAGGAIGATIGGVLGAMVGQFIEHFELTRKDHEGGW
ncbi:MAG: glycine zipper domain-containing protein [Thermoplasmata archaeon]